jgi:hypothetical protein
MLSEEQLQETLFKEVESLLPSEASESDERVIYERVNTMFYMQNHLNLLIDREWFKHEHWDFQRATMIELAELMDHYGYKWWKKQEPNIEQCKLEVIDILHFHISHLIQLAAKEGLECEHYAHDLAENLKFIDIEKSPELIRRIIDEAVQLAAIKSFDSRAMAFLMNAFDITPEELCNKYIVKNTLNIFRASNGYKEGSYVKVWNGKEDNEVLVEIFSKLDPSSTSLAEDLYNELEKEYLKLN